MIVVPSNTPIVTNKTFKKRWNIALREITYTQRDYVKSKNCTIRTTIGQLLWKKKPQSFFILKKRQNKLLNNLPFTGQRQHSLLTSGVSHALQTHEVKSRTFLAP